MSRIAFLLLLPVLASAGPLVARQAGSVATVISATTEGPACPPGSSLVTIGPDSKNVTVTFSKFRTQYDAGTGQPPEERDLFCNIHWILKFPVGCTSATLLTQTRGKPQIEQGGVTGNYFPTYVLSPGNLAGVNNQETKFDSRDPFPDFTREESPTATVRINTANEQLVKFDARTRLSIQPISQTLVGVVTIDSVDLAIANQRACT
jgi:hypothetical protein